MRKKTRAVAQNTNSQWQCWKLSHNWETVQIMPATGFEATYKDGTSFPVVAWALQARLLTEQEKLSDYGDDETAEDFITRVIGLTLCDKQATLIECTNPLICHPDDFDGYSWSL